MEFKWIWKEHSSLTSPNGCRNILPGWRLYTLNCWAETVTGIESLICSMLLTNSLRAVDCKSHKIMREEGCRSWSCLIARQMMSHPYRFAPESGPPVLAILLSFLSKECSRDSVTPKTWLPEEGRWQGQKKKSIHHNVVTGKGFQPDWETRLRANTISAWKG